MSAEYDFDIDGLRQRVEAATKLREDHVWNFAKLICPDFVKTEKSTAQRFRALVNANALFEALAIMLEEHLIAARLDLIQRAKQGWKCQTSQYHHGNALIARGFHTDLPAACLISLLSLQQQALRGIAPAKIDQATNASER